MCVIAVKPAGLRWPSARAMKNCYDSNYDGAGLSWVDEDGLHIAKGYFRWKTLWHDLKELEEYPVQVHFRLATHGSVVKDNCHPFLLANGIAMAHNGVLSGMQIPKDKDMTDSEFFGKEYLEKFTVKDLHLQKVQRLMQAAIGTSKITMQCPDGTFIIVNKEYGVEYKGLWFSNKSYEDYVKGYQYIPYRGVSFGKSYYYDEYDYDAYGNYMRDEYTRYLGKGDPFAAPGSDRDNDGNDATNTEGLNGAGVIPFQPVG
jgi:predicted glutamine amidotransferase